MAAMTPIVWETMLMIPAATSFGLELSLSLARFEAVTSAGTMPMDSPTISLTVKSTLLVLPFRAIFSMTEKFSVLSNILDKPIIVPPPTPVPPTCFTILPLS